ncbi:uncharacterized protein LOC130787788 [Actinidia eriantha]|uniref:uncharacterized protein LOC130787788 n=1 Tax=Actinidia eriantha TaxID=165200 RepID=UPI0025855FCE|nr:uncharacterized protein LOC130787788 [Actinidia eriantha]
MSKLAHHNHSSPLPSCFRPSTPTSPATHHPSTAAAPISGNPNLTTTVYNTHLGIFSLTWYRSALGRSLHLHLLLHPSDNPTRSPSSLSTSSFQLHIKPFIFWNKQGSKKLFTKHHTGKTVQVFWDLSSAKFGSRPEPQSGYYIAAVVDGEMILLAGDSPVEAYSKTRAKNPKKSQLMVLRREHVYGNKLYTTKANIRGKIREISIDCRIGDDSRLYFSVDSKRVLKIKHLNWKFRGNERIEFDGVFVQVSWDVYNWLFEDGEDGYALFMFRFEKQGIEEEEENGLSLNYLDDQKNGMVLWSQQSYGFGFEKKKMKKSLLRTTKSPSSSSSLSSASSGCSSVMEWASVEENELKDPCGFSLLVYAWKR